jgi:hypothetical protein
MNIIFQIDGGLGKCIVATAICEVIKRQHPEAQLIVVSGYPDVFINNPWVDKSFAFGQTPYFYENYIMNEPCKVHAHNPYLEIAHIKREEHLLKTWAKMFGYQYNGEFPALFLTNREKEFFAQKFQSPKPIMVIQTNGGAPNQEMKYSWARDLPQSVAQKVVEHYKNDYVICHIRREDQPALKDVVTIHGSFRELCVLLMMSHRRLLIDSFAQHAAAAFHLPSTVCWVANSEVVFGYDTHINIRANNFTKRPELRNAFLHPFDITGNPQEFPFNSENDIFDVDQIIESLK